ncbi:MAG: hypothetical protein ACI8S6_000701 [Myxococcota bacterium]|jgi:hypothetical protein
MIISLLVLLACDTEPAEHHDPHSTHEAAPEPEHHTPSNSHTPPTPEHTADTHGSTTSHEAAPESAPEPEPTAEAEAEVEAESAERSEGTRSAGVLLRPLLLALPFLLGLRLLGARARRRLPHLRNQLFVVELGALSGVLLWVALRELSLLQSIALTRAGLVTFGVLGLAGLPVVLRLAGHLRGLWLVVSGTLQVGDTIEAGPLSGTIHRIGLIQLTLKGAQGEPVIARYDALSTASIRVTSRQNRAPVMFQLDAPGGTEPIRQAALLSPYRRAGTPVHLSVGPGSGQVSVEMVLWDQTVRAEAEALLMQAAAT